MPFKEKSAWIMSVALLVGGALYFTIVATMTAGAGFLVPPNIPLVMVYALLLIIVAIMGHLIAAIAAPKDADSQTDERERRIFERAGHWSGYVFGFGVVPSLGLYLVTENGALLFYCVFASLMVSQLAEYVLQIFFYRRGI